MPPEPLIHPANHDVVDDTVGTEPTRRTPDLRFYSPLARSLPLCPPLPLVPILACLRLSRWEV
jgi:hypothetical protein